MRGSSVKIGQLIRRIRNPNGSGNSTDCSLDGVDHGLLLGCVADNNPRYLSQALRLLKSIRWFGGGCAHCDFILCVIHSVEPRYVRDCSSFDADVRVVPRYSAAYPVSNKLRFLQQPDLVRYEKILLLDCDTLIVQDPSPALGGRLLHARLAGLQNPPYAVLERIFQVFGVPLPPRAYKTTVSSEPIIPYFNTGVVGLHDGLISSLVPAWIGFVNELLNRMELLAGFEWFLEQVALSLAVATTGCEFDVLGAEMNFPFHLAADVSESRRALFQGIDPRIIHYHSLVEASGNIMVSGYPLADSRISQFNRRLNG
jgi:hypothetical protein